MALAEAKATRFNPETERIDAEPLDAWNIASHPDFEDDTGICIALRDGQDVVITEEALATLGYRPA